MVLRMLKNDMIHFSGFDCHNLDNISPKLSEALERIQKNLGSVRLEPIRFQEQLALKGER